VAALSQVIGDSEAVFLDAVRQFVHEPDERILVEDVTYQALFFERLAKDLLS
jgi:hypothetical protein